MKNKCDNLTMFGNQLKCKDCGAVWDKNDDMPDQCRAAPPAHLPCGCHVSGMISPNCKEHSIHTTRCAACNQDISTSPALHVCPGSIATATDSTPPAAASDGPTRKPTGKRFDLIPGDVIAEVARVFAEGAEKYGDYNWQKGRMTGDMDPINHAIKHVMYYNAGVADDDDPDGMDLELHLRHAIVNLMFELHYQLNPDKYDDRFNGHAGKARR